MFASAPRSAPSAAEKATGTGAVEKPAQHGERLVVFSRVLCAICGVLLVGYFLFVDYADAPDDAEHYEMFVHISIMIFVGFGFLMTFLKRYTLAAVSLNYITVCRCARGRAYAPAPL